MVSALRHLMGNGPEQQGVRGGWEWGSQYSAGMVGDCWGSLGFLPWRGTQLKGGEQGHWLSWPSASFLSARVTPKELLQVEASPHMMELGHRVIMLDVGPAWMSSNICSDRNSQSRLESAAGHTELGRTICLIRVANTITELWHSLTTPCGIIPCGESRQRTQGAQAADTTKGQGRAQWSSDLFFHVLPW